MSITLTEKEKNECFAQAIYLTEKGYTKDIDLFDLTEIIIKNIIEKKEREKITDSKIHYNDEIVSIEEVGEKETIDITVSGDNLFLCNDILTKNSIGVVSTVDFYLGIIRTDELDELGQVMFKQLKNRYGDLNYYKKFVVGLDTSKMRFYNLEDNAQKDIDNSGHTSDHIDNDDYIVRPKKKLLIDNQFDFD